MGTRLIEALSYLTLGLTGKKAAPSTADGLQPSPTAVAQTLPPVGIPTTIGSVTPTGVQQGGGQPASGAGLSVVGSSSGSGPGNMSGSNAGASSSSSSSQSVTQTLIQNAPQESQNEQTLVNTVYTVPSVAASVNASPSTPAAAPTPPPAGNGVVDQTAMVPFNSAEGLYSYESSAGNIIGTDTPPSMYLPNNPGMTLVGVPDGS